MPSNDVPPSPPSIYPVTPLCYVYDAPAELYFVFREMYMKQLFRLHSISSHPQVQYDTRLNRIELNVYLFLKTVEQSKQFEHEQI